MMAMTIKRSLAVITTVGLLFASCEGQSMRKRVASPTAHVTDLRIPDNHEGSNRNGIRNHMDFGRKRQQNIGNRKLSKAKSEPDLIDSLFFPSHVRMIGVEMSMPSSTPPGPPGSVPSQAPNDSSSLPCETLSREAALKRAVADLTDSSTLDDFGTPQGKAFVWLLGRDVAQIDQCDVPAVQQRYSLATFFYSTNGEQWDNSDGWIEDTNDCSWSGIKCDGNGRVTELGASAALSE